MLMYAANIYLWRRYRVNYSFIFGFKQGTEMDHRQVLLVSFGIAVLALISVILNLDMEMDPKTNDYKQLTELLPLNLLIVRSILFSASFNFIISKRFRNPSFFFHHSFAASTCPIVLAIQCSISLSSLLLTHLSLSLSCSSSLQGKTLWQT